MENQNHVVMIVLIRNNSNKVTIIIYVLVSGDFSNEFIVGYRDLVNLEVIPDTFLISKYTCTALDKLKDKLCVKYTDVIWDTMPKSPMAS